MITNFKVIIVGGGPVGLITAHCLSKANIDYEILERRPYTALNTGASLALWPQSVRVFDQLGLLEAVNKIHYPTKNKVNLLADGTLLSRNDLYSQIESEHGHPWMFLHRGQLLDLLVEHLPNKKTHIHFNKHVTSISTHDRGIKVTCADGTTHHASIIIGADGVNSTIRQLIHPSLPTPPPNPITTSYIGIFGSCEPLPDLEPSTFYETHGEKFTQIGPHHRRTFFFIYHRLTKPTQERHHFTEKEKEELAAQYADIHVTGTYKFKDVWDRRILAHMAHLEEGLVDTWHGAGGRAVLVGDAVHKMMPNAGLGFNCGVMSAAALTNVLRGTLLQAGGDGCKVSSKALEAAFERYQNLRKPQAKKMIDLSGLYARVVAWDNPVWKLADRYIMPHVNGDIVLLKLLLSGLVKDGVVLDFVGEGNFKEGKVKWANPRVFSDDSETQSEEGG